MASMIACEGTSNIRRRADGSMGVAEFRTLRERLELLESQRSLAAAKCQSFAAEMERSLAETLTSRKPSTWQDPTLTSGSDEGEDEWAAFGLSSTPKPRHTGPSRPRHASVEQHRIPCPRRASLDQPRGEASTEPNRVSSSHDVSKEQPPSNSSSISSGEAVLRSGPHHNAHHRDTHSAPEEGTRRQQPHSRARRASFEADAAAVEYYSSCRKTASRRSSFAHDSSSQVDPCTRSTTAAVGAAAGYSPIQTSKARAEFTFPEAQSPQGHFQYMATLSSRAYPTSQTLGSVPAMSRDAQQSLGQLAHVEAGPCLQVDSVVPTCPRGSDTDAVDTSEASDAESFLFVKARFQAQPSDVSKS